MTDPDDDGDVVELVVRLPRHAVSAYREHHQMFLLRLQRDHDHVAMSGPFDGDGAEQARLDRLRDLSAALQAGRAVTRATLATGAAKARGAAAPKGERP